MAGARTPGPWGVGYSFPVIDGWTLALIEMPPPGTAPDATAVAISPPAASAAIAASTQYKLEDTLKHINAHAHTASQGQCAKYVRQAIEAGGVTISVPRPLYAKDYGPKLAELGFAKIDSTDYVPQKGDIVVLQPPNGQSAGHIQIYNGENWVSDFVKGSGIYPGPAYRKEKVAYEIYRP